MSRGTGVVKALVQPQTRRTLCRIINVLPKPQIIRKGTPLEIL